MNISTKSKQIHLRVSEQEHDEIASKARSAGYTTSDFLRKCAVDGKVCPVQSVNREQWAKLAATTSNLNQLTHLANQGVVPANLGNTLHTTATILKDVRKALIGAN